jgi:serpin B
MPLIVSAVMRRRFGYLSRSGVIMRMPFRTGSVLFAVTVVLAAMIIGWGSASSSLASDAKEEAPKSDVTENELSALADGNLAFGTDLYREVAKRTEGNFVISAHGLSTALCMIYTGARNKTAEEMEKTLHLPMKGERVHRVLAAINKKLVKKDDQGGDLFITNGIWQKTGYELKKPFLEVLQRDYGATYKEANFSTEPEKAKKEINDWIFKETRGKISNVVEGRDVNPLTLSVILNSIYFKQKWMCQLRKETP